jgi:hypothetical protein
MTAEQPLITRTDFVFLPITSFKKAEEFYGGVLGLRCSARYRDDLGGEFETGSLTIQVVDSAKIGRAAMRRERCLTHRSIVDQVGNARPTA